MNKTRLLNKHGIKYWKIVMMLILITISIISFYKLNNTSEKNSLDIANTTTSIQNKKVKVTLDKTIDGDTASFVVNDQKQTFRFLSINTPEMKTQQGKDVKAYVDNVLKKCQDIYIEYDNKAEKDKYGRSLAWIWVDDKLLQLELVEKGYAKVEYLYDDYKYNNLLLQSEKNNR